MNYELEGGDSILDRSKKFVSCSTASRPDLEPCQAPTKWVRRLDPQADHSPPSSTEVLNGGALPVLPNSSLWRGA